MFGKLIQDERLKQKISQEELALKLNVKKETIEDYEKNKSSIPFSSLIRLSKIFKKPIGYFFQEVIVSKKV